MKYIPSLILAALLCLPAVKAQAEEPQRWEEDSENPDGERAPASVPERGPVVEETHGFAEDPNAKSGEKSGSQEKGAVPETEEDNPVDYGFRFDIRAGAIVGFSGQSRTGPLFGVRIIKLFRGMAGPYFSYDHGWLSADDEKDSGAHMVSLGGLFAWDAWPVHPIASLGLGYWQYYYKRQQIFRDVWDSEKLEDLYVDIGTGIIVPFHRYARLVVDLKFHIATIERGKDKSGDFFIGQIGFQTGF